MRGYNQKIKDLDKPLFKKWYKRVHLKHPNKGADWEDVYNSLHPKDVKKS